MAAIRLPDLTQKVKIDSKDMLLASQRATAFGTKMKAMSRDVDESNKRMTRSMKGLDKQFDSTTSKMRDQRRAYGDMGRSAERLNFDNATKSMRELADANKQTTSNLREQRREVSAIQRSWKSIPKRVQTKVSQDGAAKVNAEITKAARDRRTKIHVDADTINAKTIMGKIGKTGMGFEKFALPTGLLTGIQALIPLAGSAVQQLISLSQAALALPAGMSMAAAAVAPLGIAFKGLKKSGDASFATLKKQIAPLTAGFRQLQTNIRADLFTGLGESLANLGRKTIPALQGSLRGVAKAWNYAFRVNTDFLATPETLSRLKTIIGGTSPVVKNLGVQLRGVLDGFLNMSVSGVPVIQQLSSGLTKLTTKFKDWAQASADSGQMTVWMEEGVQTAGRLFKVLGNVLGLVLDIGKLGAASGADFLGVVDRLATGLRDIFQDPKAAKGFTEAFQGVGQVVAGLTSNLQPFKDVIAYLGGLIKDLGGSIGGIVQEALPSLAGIFIGISPALANILDPIKGLVREIGPGLVSISVTLGKFMTTLGSMAGRIVTALAPVAGEVIDVLARVLPGAIEALMPLFESLVRTVEGVSPALIAVADAAEPVLRILSELVGAATTLLGPLAPMALALFGVSKAMAAVKASMATGMLSGIAKGFQTAVAAASEAKAIFSETAAAAKQAFQFSGGGLKGAQAATATMARGASAAGGAITGLGAAFGVVAPAIGIATVAIGAWVQAQENARAAGEAYAQTMDKVTGAFTEATRSKAISDLQKEVNPDDWKEADAALRHYGVTMTDFIRDHEAGGAAVTGFNTRMQALLDSVNNGDTTLTDNAALIAAISSAYKNLGGDVERGSAQAKQAAGIQNELAHAYDGTQESTATAAQLASHYGDAVSGAGDAASGAKGSVDEFGNVIAESGDKAATTTAAINDLKNAIDLLGGGERAMRAAQRQLADSIDETKQKAKDYTAAVKEHGAKSQEAKKAARDWSAAIEDQAKNINDVTSAMMENKQPAKDITKAYNDQRAALLKALGARGLHGAAAEAEADKIMGTRDAMQELIDKYNGTPDAVTTDVTANTENAQSKVEGYWEVINGVPTFHATKMDATTDTGEVQGYWEVINGVPTFHHTDLTASTDQPKVEGYWEVINGVPTFHKTNMSVTGTKGSTRDIDEVKQHMRDVKDKRVKLDATTAPAKKGVDGLRGAIANTKDKHVTVSASVTGKSAVEDLWAAIKRVASKVVSVVANVAASAVHAMGQLYSAPGVAKFARGSEDHRAQIARPGDWRVWAEPETGGEAYIPFAKDRRPRSKAIWAETGKRLGISPAAINAMMRNDLGYRAGLAMAAGGMLASPPVPFPQTTAQSSGPQIVAVQITSGALTIDPQGRAYIRGEAQVVLDANAAYANALGRMN